MHAVSLHEASTTRREPQCLYTSHQPLTITSTAVCRKTRVLLSVWLPSSRVFSSLLLLGAKKTYHLQLRTQTSVQCQELSIDDRSQGKSVEGLREKNEKTKKAVKKEKNTRPTNTQTRSCLAPSTPKSQQATGRGRRRRSARKEHNTPHFFSFLRFSGLLGCLIKLLFFHIQP